MLVEAIFNLTLYSLLGPSLHYGFEGGKIIGGHNANPGDFPYQISLRKSNIFFDEHICGGSILNENWIITAAQCVDTILPPSLFFKVKAGSIDLESENELTQTVNIKQVIIHEKYQHQVGPFDIALVELETPLTWNGYVKPINLPLNNSIPSAPSLFSRMYEMIDSRNIQGIATLSGWGSKYNMFCSKSPVILQTVDLPLVDFVSCKYLWNEVHDENPLDESNICTGPLEGKISPCNGDSGGPLVQKTEHGVTLIGIVSWGYKPCGTSNVPSVYTRISAHLDWIHTLINPVSSLN